MSPRTVSTTVKINGRRMEPGTEFGVRGEPGRFRFRQYVEAPAGAWVDAFDASGAFRSFAVDRVRVVHRTRRMATRGASHAA